MKPISRVVVSLPAPAIMLVYVSTSVRVSWRVPPSSSTSALSSCVIRSSDGWSARQSMYSANNRYDSSNALSATANWPSFRSIALLVVSRISCWPCSGMPSK